MTVDRDFWIERWDSDQIGFHQPQGQPLLPEFWPTLELATDTPVLVPLCGKTPDMVWLANRGHAVTGVEYSQRAARDFFDEQGLPASVDQLDGFERHRGGGVDILVGDFLALPADRLAVFGGVYDRAALIALPPERRAAYAAHLLAGLSPDAAILLIALDYDPREMQGPPFAVGENEVRALYGGDCDIFKVKEQNMAPNDHLRAKGLTKAREQAYRMTRR